MPNLRILPSSSFLNEWIMFTVGLHVDYAFLDTEFQQHVSWKLATGHLSPPDIVSRVESPPFTQN